jgi:hypothetical protein
MGRSRGTPSPFKLDHAGSARRAAASMLLPERAARNKNALPTSAGHLVSNSEADARLSFTHPRLCYTPADLHRDQRGQYQRSGEVGPE